MQRNNSSVALVVFSDICTSLQANSKSGLDTDVIKNAPKDPPMNKYLKYLGVSLGKEYDNAVGRTSNIFKYNSS